MNAIVMNAIHKVYEFDPLDVKKVSESQKCAQTVLSSNERHKLAPHKTGWLKQLTPMNE